MSDLIGKIRSAQIKAAEDAVMERLKDIDLLDDQEIEEGQEVTIRRYTHEDLRKWGEALDMEMPHSLGEELLRYACDWREERDYTLYLMEERERQLDGLSDAASFAAEVLRDLRKQIHGLDLVAHRKGS